MSILYYINYSINRFCIHWYNNIDNAWTTSLCNIVTDSFGLNAINEIASSNSEMLGFLAIFEDSMLVGGNIEIINLKSSVYEI